MSYLVVDDIHCEIARSQVLRGTSFRLEKGEIGCLLGPSGCGKTTVLRALAGFQPLLAGRIELAQELLSDASHSMAPEQRGVSMVFQDYALFPHLTVAQNVAFGLQRLKPDERRRRVAFQLELTKLDALGERYPHELSGGQQQRVALARALATQPRLLLLDEPFSGLDSDLRRELGLRVREILKNQQITAILVTHDQEEAFSVADQVGVMQDGRILQWASPYSLYHEPVSRFVADFVGRGVFLPGRTQTEGSVITELGEISGRAGRTVPSGSQVQVLLRPDDVVQDQSSPYRAIVTNKIFIGTSTLYTLRLPSGHQIESMLPSHENFPLGAELGVRVDADHLILFDQS